MNSYFRKFILLLAFCFVINASTQSALADIGHENNLNVNVCSTKLESNRILRVPEKQVDRERLSRGSNSITDRLVEYSYKFIGKPYVWAAAGPMSFDCSGFTLYVYNKFGYSLPHYTGYQVEMGNSVSKQNLKTGDLIFFNTTGLNSHVGIYIGGGRFIHASSGKGSITISELDKPYYRQRYSTARRIIE
ncbi:C40 family peptidase [Clostridium sp. MB40-C1]|uniref:C40 family peptidase n=1 Tax=Clostridium sp. MB40-C1 TaxID=3070996 RepID=UPI0027DEEF43|nr:C40 family peptidase [Clostridium sp. MB40-C1]WMJ81032.1 C40 family peptidase [Clostridium sp. MB40-C1]